MFLPGVFAAGCADYVGPSLVCSDGGDAIVFLSQRTVDISNDPENCGCVGARCPRNPHGSQVCTNGRCGTSCAGLWGDCNGDPSDGCELYLNEVSYCGACGVVCALPHATAMCTDGACAVASCEMGYSDCNHSAADGCEVDLNTVANCGGCGVRCDLPNATPSCLNQTCRVSVCLTGYEDCDRLPSNGCEVDLRSDYRNCGACFSACSSNGATPRCVARQCVPICISGRATCENSSVDTSNNGCEADLVYSNTHCGACGRACLASNLPHTATAYCTNGQCAASTCVNGWGNCDRDPLDGCETNLNSPATCGACNRDCASMLQHVTGTMCVRGICDYPACAMGYSDCDGNRENGCEAARTTC